ncbi:Cysteine desulfurase [Candidatus Johnevansia muelleri]|uniref:Cysteine desulfurase n=1 Tax=Candidatus Johnevansia muelleri TaxID=1495769 RepID=A0A078KE43_9GAMM|nr:Cysteine desulfurase [Candidatus Evansia muelleri]
MQNNKLKQKFDIKKIRKEFPILNRCVYNNYPLIYLDNAATTQIPQVVIDVIDDYYQRYNANIHRGIHCISDEATIAYEDARIIIRNFINAKDNREIIFTRGTTESINLVAQSYGRKEFKFGDEILISSMEHHSNIVPWQLLAHDLGLIIKVIPIDEQGCIDIQNYEELFTKRTRIVTITHVSNVLGTINPIKLLANIAHKNNTLIIVDGAQAVQHIDVDVQDLDVDFYAFSGHKVYGPNGIGVLYGKLKLLELMPPWQGGGEMIESVNLEGKTKFSQSPHKFEAGTPAIIEAIALGRALCWLTNYNFDFIKIWEKKLLFKAYKELQKIDGVYFIGKSYNKTAVISFVIEGIHAQDIGLLIDQYGVAIRTGHHCAQPLLNLYGLNSTCRISFGIYNTLEEVNYFINSLHNVISIMRG